MSDIRTSNTHGVNKTINRWLVVLGGIMIMVCGGLLHGWSVFVIPITQFYGWDRSVVALVGSVMLAMFGVGMFIGGTVLNKLGPKKTILLGSMMFGGGVFCSAFASNPILVYAFYGIIAGLGNGIAYMATMFTCLKWFPDMRGTINGIVLSSFGFSLVILAPGVTAMLSGWGVTSTFMILGAIFITVMGFSALFIMRTPPEGWMPKNFSKKALDFSSQKQYTVSEAKSTRSFILLTLSQLTMPAAYVMLIPYLVVYSTTVKSLDLAMAVAGVSLIGVGSAFGRLLISSLQDKIGCKYALLITCAATIASALLLIPAEGALVIACFFLIGFGFGGATPIYPVMTANTFGIKNSSAIYGLIALAIVACNLIWPTVSTALVGATNGSYTFSLVLAAFLSLFTAVTFFMVKGEKKCDTTVSAEGASPSK